MSNYMSIPVYDQLVEIEENMELKNNTAKSQSTARRAPQI